MQFIVLSSSRGTTFKAVLDALRDGSLTAICKGLISDRPSRQCIEKAGVAGIPFVVVEKRNGEDRESYDRRLHQAVLRLFGDGIGESRVLCALGWLSIFSPWFVGQWRNRIINVHPALLPRHGGEGMYGSHVHEAVLSAGETESGITIHLMDEDVDTGPILEQKSCSVSSGDTVQSLQAKVQELEKEWYPKVLQRIETGELALP